MISEAFAASAADRARSIAAVKRTAVFIELNVPASRDA
jgi:hypothetical protein